MTDRPHRKPYRVEKGGKRDVFTEEEIKLVLADAAVNETSKIIAIFLYTGFRLQELLDMPMSGVDMDELLRLVGHVDKETTQLYLHDDAGTIRDIVKSIR